MEFKWLRAQQLVLGSLHFAGSKAFALKGHEVWSWQEVLAIVTLLSSIVLTPDIATME